MKRIVEFKQLYEDVITPTKAKDGDACWDLYVHSVERESDKFVLVHTGLCILPPKGYSGSVKPRSSHTKTDWCLLNSPAVIDQYTGEWMFRFRAFPVDIEWEQEDDGSPYLYLGYPLFPYQKGDRFAQFEFHKIEDFQLVNVDELSPTDRGSGGFGSTGK